MMVNGLPNAESFCRLLTGQPMARISEGDKTFFLEGMGKISMWGRGAESGGTGRVSSCHKTFLLAAALRKLTTALRAAQNANDNAIGSIEDTFRDATTPSDIALKNRCIEDANRNYQVMIHNLNSLYEFEASRIERM